MAASAHSFWSWSLDVYARPGVERILLDLQDRLDLDVNILLFACWSAAGRRLSLSVDELEAVVAATADWRNKVVQPLRGVRRFIKRDGQGADADSLCEQVGRLELEAERVMQLKIARVMEEQGKIIPQSGDLVQLALANLKTYLAAMQVVPHENDRAILATLARACCASR